MVSRRALLGLLLLGLLCVHAFSLDLERPKSKKAKASKHTSSAVKGRSAAHSHKSLSHKSHSHKSHAHKSHVHKKIVSEATHENSEATHEHSEASESSSALPPLTPHYVGQWYAPCSKPPCGTPKGLAGKHFNFVKVRKPSGICGCLAYEICPCRVEPYVKPELRPDPSICACLASKDCNCRPKQLVEVDVPSQDLLHNKHCGCAGHHGCPCGDGKEKDMVTHKLIPQTLVTAQDECGCTHLEICPCRKVEFVEPEIKAKKPDMVCACRDEPDCSCRSAQKVIPELKQNKKYPTGLEV